MKPEHIEAAASAGGASVAKLGVVWGAVVAGFSGLPWAQLAAAAAFFYSLHLIVGWWMDRVGKRQPPKRRNSRSGQ